MTGLGARMERDESVQGLSNGNWGELSFPCCLSDIGIFLVTSDHHYFMPLYLLSYLFSPGLHLSLFSVLFYLASPFRNQPRFPDVISWFPLNLYHYFHSSRFILRMIQRQQFSKPYFVIHICPLNMDLCVDRAALFVVRTDCCVNTMQLLPIGRIYLWTLFGPVHGRCPGTGLNMAIGRKVTLIVIRVA